MEVGPNRAITVDISNRDQMRVVKSVLAVEWKLNQFKTSTVDYRRAFKRALAKRALHSDPEVELHVALSFGLDSGLVHCVLNQLRLPHSVYSIIGTYVRTYERTVGVHLAGLHVY